MELGVGEMFVDGGVGGGGIEEADPDPNVLGLDRHGPCDIWKRVSDLCGCQNRLLP